MTAPCPDDFPIRYKDPSATKDFPVDWSDWLEEAGNDTIASVAWTIPAGLTLESQTETTTVASAWLSGGTEGEEYEIICTITTAGGRVEPRTLVLRVLQH